MGRPRPTISFARSWDLGSARPPERRAGGVIFVAQLVLRPLIRLLAGRQWIGTHHFPERGAAVACGNHSGPFDALAYGQDRKSTRLNSSHVAISYAVFC